MKDHLEEGRSSSWSSSESYLPLLKSVLWIIVVSGSRTRHGCLPADHEVDLEPVMGALPTHRIERLNSAVKSIFNTFSASNKKVEISAKFRCFFDVEITFIFAKTNRLQSCVEISTSKKSWKRKNSTSIFQYSTPNRRRNFNVFYLDAKNELKIDLLAGN